MGHDRMDDLLYHCHSCFLIPPSFILVLEDGWFLLGCHAFGAWRVRKENDRSRKPHLLCLVSSKSNILLQDEGKFDSRAIPLKSWSDYVRAFSRFWSFYLTTAQENELWDKESNHSIGSWVPPAKSKEGYAESHTVSIYGRETHYDPRSYSPALSQVGMYQAPGYQSGRNTPQSTLRPFGDPNLLYQPAPSRPVTNFLDIPIPTTGSPDNFNLSSGDPTDAELEQAVQNVLRGADLNSVTKREIRRQLEDHFGMDLTARKASINSAIDRVLLSQVWKRDFGCFYLFWIIILTSRTSVIWPLVYLSLLGLSSRCRH